VTLIQERKRLENISIISWGIRSLSCKTS